MTMVNKWLCGCVTVMAMAAGLMVGRVAAAEGELPDPRKGSDLIGAQMIVPQQDLDLFKTWYKTDREPKMLVIVGRDARIQLGGERPQGAVGIGKAEQPGVGADIAFFDPSGITEVLREQIGAWLMESTSRTRLISLAALSEQQKRQATLDAVHGEVNALIKLATSTNARIIFYVRMQPIPPEQRIGRDTMPYRFVVRVIDVETAREFPGDAFSFDGSTANQNLRRYSAAMTSVLIKRYCKYIKELDEGYRYALSIRGLSDRKTIKGLLDLIEKMDGVLARPEDSTTVDVVDLDVEIKGRPTKFPDQLVEMVQEKFNVKLEVTDKQPAKAVMLWSGTTDGPGRPRAFPPADFAELYTQKDEPTIGVIVNWLMRPDEVPGRITIYSRPWFEMVVAEKPGAVQFKDVPRDVRNPQGFNFIEISQFERGMLGCLATHCKVTAIDSETIRESFRKQAIKETINNDQKASQILMLQDGFDILIHGWATPDNANAPKEIKYSFMATDVKTGKVLGSLNLPDGDWERQKALLRAFAGNVPGVSAEPTQDQVIHFATHKLMEQMIESYFKGSISLQVRVNGVNDEDKLSALCETLETNIRGAKTTGVRMDNGLGGFKLSYPGSYKGLVNRIRTEKARLPFVVATQECNPGILVLKIKGE